MNIIVTIIGLIALLFAPSCPECDRIEAECDDCAYDRVCGR